MASATKCIKFSTLFLVAYLIMVTEANHHMALNALLATGLLTLLLRGKHGGHGHGGYSHLSALSHGNSFGHHSSFSGFNFPHSFGIGHQNPIDGFDLNPLYHGLGNEFDLGMIKPARPLHNAGALMHIPHISGLKQVEKEVHPSIPNTPFYGAQNNEPFSNSGHKQIPLQGQIPSAPVVTSGNPYEYEKPSGAVQNPNQHYVNQFFVMPRHAADELIEILENNNAYASFNENLETEKDKEDYRKPNYPPSPEEIYQFDPRSSGDIPYENPVPNLQ